MKAKASNSAPGYPNTIVKSHHTNKQTGLMQQMAITTIRMWSLLYPDLWYEERRELEFLREDYAYKKWS